MKKKTKKQEHPSQAGGKTIKAIWRCQYCQREQGILRFDPSTKHGRNLLHQLGWDEKSGIVVIDRPCCVHLEELIGQAEAQGFVFRIGVEDNTKSD